METYLCRKVTREVTFDKRTDDFGNYYDAGSFIKSAGYSHGSMCGSLPIAIVKGEYPFTQKWRNFSVSDKKSVDGVMVGDFREGAVKVYFFDEMPINL